MRDGDRVSYVGFVREGLALGDRGKVVSANGDSSHVQWATGARVGCIDLVDDLDLVPTPGSRTAAASVLTDSLEVGPLVTLSVRETLEESGEAGLLNTLNESGHLAGLGPIAEDTLQFVAGRLRQDDAFAGVLGQLEPEEASSLIALTASVLMRDAFGQEEGP